MSVKAEIEKTKLQVQVVDQTTHPPKCHSFVGLDRQIGSSPPALFEKGRRGKKKEGSFTSIQMLHTHTLHKNTLCYTTLHYTTLHYTTLLYNYNYSWTDYSTLQLQLHYATTTTTTALHHTTSSSCGWGDRCNHCNHSKKHKSNHLSVHEWIRCAIRDSQQLTSPIGFLFLKLPPPPCAILLVKMMMIMMVMMMMIALRLRRLLGANHGFRCRRPSGCHGCHAVHSCCRTWRGGYDLRQMSSAKAKVSV